MVECLEIKGPVKVDDAYLNLSDSELVEKIREENLVAHRVLYERYHPKILKYYTYKMGDDDEMEDRKDLTVDVLERTLESIASGKFKDGPACLNTWIHKVAKNCLIDYRRHEEVIDRGHARYVSRVKPFLPEFKDPLDVLVQREEARDLGTLASRCTELQKNVLLLKLGGFPNSLIAEKLNITLYAVKALYRRAIKGIKRDYAEEFGNKSPESCTEALEAF